MDTPVAHWGSVESNLQRAQFAVIVTTAFTVVAALVLHFHEPWRDEYQAWTLARDIGSIPALLAEMHRVGHPPFWYLLLRALSRIGDFRYGQLANLTFGVGTTWLFVRYSPFSRLCRGLFPFGYFPLFEYPIIARNYSCGVFFLFLFAALFPLRRNRPLLPCLALAAAANTSIHAAVVAAAALLVLVVERFQDIDGAPEDRARTKAFWACIAIATVGIATSVTSVVPAPDFLMGNAWPRLPPLRRFTIAASAIVKAFAASPWLKTPGVADVSALRTIVLLVSVPLCTAFATTVALTLVRRRVVLILGIVSVATLLFLFYARYYSGARHAGFMYIAMVLALWLAPSFSEQKLRGRLLRYSEFSERIRHRVLIGTFSWHILSGLFAAGIDLRYTFSAAEATAQMVQKEKLAELPIVADGDLCGSNVVGQLGRKPAFYANVQRWGTFVIQDSRHGETTTCDDVPADERVFGDAISLAQHRDVLVLFSHKPTSASVKAACAGLVGARLAEVKNDESYWVYIIRSREGKPCEHGSMAEQ